ncbi:hypothetical protein MTO96_028707 [Rhipicephalus appendiculatus]
MEVEEELQKETVAGITLRRLDVSSSAGGEFDGERVLERGCPEYAGGLEIADRSALSRAGTTAAFTGTVAVRLTSTSRRKWTSPRREATTRACCSTPRE